jgi:hypothetical protein
VIWGAVCLTQWNKCQAYFELKEMVLKIFLAIATSSSDLQAANMLKAIPPSKFMWIWVEYGKPL